MNVMRRSAMFVFYDASHTPRVRIDDLASAQTLLQALDGDLRFVETCRIGDAHLERGTELLRDPGQAFRIRDGHWKAFDLLGSKEALAEVLLGRGGRFDDAVQLTCLRQRPPPGGSPIRGALRERDVVMLRPQRLRRRVGVAVNDGTADGDVFGAYGADENGRHAPSTSRRDSGRSTSVSVRASTSQALVSHAASSELAYRICPPDWARGRGRGRRGGRGIVQRAAQAAIASGGDPSDTASPHHSSRGPGCADVDRGEPTLSAGAPTDEDVALQRCDSGHVRRRGALGAAGRGSNGRGRDFRLGAPLRVRPSQSEVVVEGDDSSPRASRTGAYGAVRDSACGEVRQPNGGFNAAAWLLEVDPLGSLTMYVDELSSRFSFVHELHDAYQALGQERFLASLGISKVGHRRFFIRALCEGR